jgi:hypothetical protein
LRACSFRFYFIPLSGVLFTFPSRYLYTIGLRGVFSLAGWCRRIRRGFLRPPPTQGFPPTGGALAYGALTLCGPASQRARRACRPCTAALQPRARLDARGLGSTAFARHYTRYHYCFLLLGVLRCFSSPRSPASPRASAAGCRLSRSGTPRSMALSASRGNFAAVRALQSLPKPRHPLHALHTARASAVARRRPCLWCAMACHASILHTFAAAFAAARMPKNFAQIALVENIGVEPMASCLQSRRSSQLS